MCTVFTPCAADAYSCLLGLVYVCMYVGVWVWLHVHVHVWMPL